jgi:hypothetical protein
VTRFRCVILEPCDFEAEVQMDGGQVENYMIAGSPIIGTPYNDKLDLVLADNRTIALNWSKVHMITFTPRKTRETSIDVPKDIFEAWRSQGRIIRFEELVTLKDINGHDFYLTKAEADALNPSHA